MGNQSLSDLFIDVMAQLRALDISNNDEPMRHAIRSLKMTAESTIECALRSASSIAYHAGSLPRDCEEAVKEACAALNEGKDTP